MLILNWRGDKASLPNVCPIVMIPGVAADRRLRTTSTSGSFKMVLLCWCTPAHIPTCCRLTSSDRNAGGLVGGVFYWLHASFYFSFQYHWHSLASTLEHLTSSTNHHVLPTACHDCQLSAPHGPSAFLAMVHLSDSGCLCVVHILL